MRLFNNNTILTPLLFVALSLSGHAQTHTWTGADPSGYWSAPANWSPAGVPVNGADLVFPGGLPPGDRVSTNDLIGSIFRSIRFDQAGGHTIRGNPITLTNRSDCIVTSGTNVIACDLTFTGTPSTPQAQFASIRGLGSGELTLIGNVGGGSLYVINARLVIRGQFNGGTLHQQYGSLAFYGDHSHAVSASIRGSSFSTLRVEGSQPNLNIMMLREMESAECPSMSGNGLVGDVTGCGRITPDSTLSVKNVSGRLDIYLNGINVGEYGRLVASGDVNLSSGRLLTSPGFSPQAGQVYTIVEKTSPGPIANAFLGPDGSVTTLNGMPFRISYVGGDGNDVTLTAVAPVVTWLEPANGATLPAGSTIVLRASATVSEGTVSFVDFFANSNLLGRAVPTSENVYSFWWSNAPAGTFRLHAEAVDDAGNRGVSGSVQITLSPVGTFSDANWSALGTGLGNTPGWYSVVKALAVAGSSVYAGGFFTTAGGSPAGNIAKWDGTNWSPLGSGVEFGFDLEGATTSVDALAKSGDDLYVGGLFKWADGIPAPNIAKWNGTDWSAVGLGVGGGRYATVFALAVSGSDLYAGGSFTTAGGSPATRIAKWDGSNWSTLGSGMNLPVRALAVSGNDLYAGGDFTTAGGTPANRVARWNGSSWSVLGSGMNITVYALAVSGSDLYAGGSFTTAGGSSATNIGKWNGTTWSALGSGLSGGSNPFPAVYALAVSGSSLCVGGGFTTAGGIPANRVAKVRIASAAESITRTGSSATIQFSGVVGYAYHVQRTTSLSAPITWTTLTTNPLLPASDGSLTFTDTNAPPGTAYYRLVQH